MKVVNLIPVCFGLILCAIGATAHSEPETFASGTKQNRLVELYTSEGCSSCPPADRWLSSLKDNDFLWRDVIPVAFHVDYWDRLGWSDRFASSKFSARQRQYAREHSEAVVYTPGMRLGGKEWRSWRNSSSDLIAGTDPEVGNLVVSISEDGQLTASFDLVEGDSKNTYTLNVAILGMGASTQVQRGENRGRELKHDFVVLAHSDFIASDETPTQWQESLPIPTESAPKYALAAWVSRQGSLDPVQATGGYLASSPDGWQ
ncbi:MAG: DUF1223 domain-containing protein [Pseudomonadota bacterium]